MRLLILSLGRWHKGPEQALFEHFADRFAPLARRLGLGPLELREIGGRGADDSPQALIAACPAGAYRVALDASGTAMTSEALAAFLRLRRLDACPALAFFIGGADGLGAILGETQQVISLGPQTWPHLLVRGLLAEQIYRSATILLNHPYHLGH